MANLIHGDIGEVCPQANLSSALSKFLPALPLRKGKTKILLSANDFPSLGYVIKHMCGNDYQIAFIPPEEDLHDVNRWESYLKDDVAIALLTHVQSNTGRNLPIDAITALCHEKDIISIVDIAQSAGVLPVNVQRWQADCVIGSSVKWLCGGPGAGFMWIKSALIPCLSPIDVGWFSHENPVEFDILNFQYAKDALRFWGGTPSVAPFIIAANSINTLLNIGIVCC